MFNLDHAITEWRRQMSAGGVQNSAVLDELESHVREDVERQMRSGADAQKAFDAAVKKIGPASALKNEFKKSTAAAIIEKLMIVVAAFIMAFGAFLSVVTLLLCYPSVAERAVGFIVISLTFGTLCVWPAFISRLPVVHSRRKLFVWQITSLAAGIAVSTFYVQVILPAMIGMRDGVIPAIGFLAIFPIAVGLALAAGLDRAARKTSDKITT
jgi:hypothetical protein